MSEAAASQASHDYRIRLDNFEGPLDLLLQLIEARELDITEVSLAAVTDQYLEYIKSLEPFDLEIASDFAAVAARLLEIKAKTLLPPPKPEADEGEGEESDPESELIRRLLAYRQFKEAAQLLKEKGEASSLLFTRLPDDAAELAREIDLGTVSLAALLEALAAVLEQAEDETAAAIELTPEQLSIEECMRRIVWGVRRAGDRLRFHELFRAPVTRLEVVVTFLALLELLRRRRVAVEQRDPSQPIEIVWRGEGHEPVTG